MFVYWNNSILNPYLKSNLEQNWNIHGYSSYSCSWNFRKAGLYTILDNSKKRKKKPAVFLFQRYGSYCPVCSILWSNKDTVPSLVKTKRVSFSAISIFSALSGNIFTEYYPFFQLFPVIFLQKYDHKNAAFKWQQNHIT